jgi:hypothetical protein
VKRTGFQFTVASTDGAALAEDEARNSVETKDMFVIHPANSRQEKENSKDEMPVAEGFHYASDTNSEWLTAEDLYKFVQSDAPPLSSETGSAENRIQ